MGKRSDREPRDDAGQRSAGPHPAQELFGAAKTEHLAEEVPKKKHGPVHGQVAPKICHHAKSVPGKKHGEAKRQCCQTQEPAGQDQHAAEGNARNITREGVSHRPH